MATAATSRTTPITYLFAENQDCELPIPALKTNSRVAKTSGVASGNGRFGGLAPCVAGGGRAVSPLASFTTADARDAGLEAAAAAGTPRVKGIATLAAADCAAANARASLGAAATGALAAGIAACRAPPPCGTFSWPRHFFSSHSTHSTRPAETGKPQASHLRRPRSMGGTWLRSASPGFSVSGAEFTPADQNNFLGVTVSAGGGGTDCTADAAVCAAAVTSSGTSGFGSNG